MNNSTKYLIYDAPEAEYVCLRRDAITSFVVKYIKTLTFRVLARVNGETHIVFQGENHDSCKAWIKEQIDLLEEE